MPTGLRAPGSGAAMTGDPVSASAVPVSALARGIGNTGIEPMATRASSFFQFDTHSSSLTLNRFHCPHSIPDDMFEVPTVLIAGLVFLIRCFCFQYLKMTWALLLVGYWTCHLGWIPGPSLAGWNDNFT